MGEAAVSKKRPKNLFYWINSIIVFVLMFGIGQLPPFGQITPLGMQILGIFAGTLYGWCTVGLVSVSYTHLDVYKRQFLRNTSRRAGQVKKLCVRGKQLQQGRGEQKFRYCIDN